MPNVMTETKTRATTQKITGLRGLCGTCSLSTTCTFPRASERPIMHCDEFEGYEFSKTVSSTKTTGISTVAENRVELKGLCKNCENRPTCSYPKPESGVWRCEEYE
jgi:hypothetical protein